MKSLFKLRYLVLLVFPLLLWWSLSDVPLADIRHTLARLTPARLALLVGFNLLVMLVFSSRWWLILRLLGQRLPYLPLLGHRMAGFSVSYLTPGTQFGGEPLQVYLLEKHHNTPRSAALASITLDKLFELLANFTFLAVGIVILLQGRRFADWLPGQAIFWIFGLLLLPPVYLALLWTGRLPATGLAKRLPDSLKDKAIFHKTLPLFTAAETQISALLRQKPLSFLWIMLTSALIWLLSIGEYWLAATLLGGQLDLKQTFSALTAARLAFLVPLPGGLGALEASQVLAMQALGLGAALGISLSLWIRARELSLALLGFGWTALHTGRFSVRRTPQAMRLPSPAEEAAQAVE
jgi:uncharacterized protein (TIRG00374 family)